MSSAATASTNHNDDSPRRQPRALFLILGLAAALLLDLQAAAAAVPVPVSTTAAGDGDCEPPTVPRIPDAEAASAAEVAAAGSEVRAFVQAGQAYLACIDRREAKLGPRLTAEQKSFMTLLYNATVDRMQLVANQYNTLVREFNAQ